MLNLTSFTSAASLLRTVSKVILGSQNDTVLQKLPSFDWELWLVEQRPYIEKLIGINPINGRLALFKPFFGNTLLYDVMTLDVDFKGNEEKFVTKIGEFIKRLETNHPTQGSFREEMETFSPGAPPQSPPTCCSFRCHLPFFGLTYL